MKLWEKNYSLDQQVEKFTVGDDYILDQRLVRYDCRASIAHAGMLMKIGILSEDEFGKLESELNQINQADEQGAFIISRNDEDCHTAIENELVRKLGDLGKKIHTARSRNDQVLTALRLYYRDEIDSIKGFIKELNDSIKAFVKKYGNVRLPGFTHTRKAMPSSVNLWGSAFMDAMADNLKLLDFVRQLINQSPLGTGAGYGVPLDIDREYTAKVLGFAKVQTNPVYAQISRGKFESTILHALTQVMFDLNKIATDLILFSMPEFGYFELPDEFCTGSSMMPQKKNPDVLELVRAKYHVVVSYEMQIKSMVSNLITGYSRDYQLTKEPVFKGFDITRESLNVVSLVFSKLKLNKENCTKGMSSEIFATNEVYELVRQGIPFRDAYQIVAKKY